MKDQSSNLGNHGSGKCQALSESIDLPKLQLHFLQHFLFFHMLR